MFILELSQLQLKLQLEFVYLPVIIVFNLLKVHNFVSTVSSLLFEL